MTNLVEISGLNIRFTGERTVHAVNDLSLNVQIGRDRIARCILAERAEIVAAP